MSTDETRSLLSDQARPNDQAGSSRERRLDDAIAAYLAALGTGGSPNPQPWLERYPDLSSELKAFFADHQRLERLAQPVRAATASLPAGSRVHYVGDYELLREVGRGGMGVVYEARQVSLNRIVAVKMILAGELATPAEVERFYAEARTAATLQHPHIVAMHEVGQHEGQHYFSMDYVSGKSLAEIVRGQPLPPKQAATYVRAIAEAIQFAHEQGILHRDLKPSNVLIDRFDQPRVTDFGLAKRVTGDDPRTATGAVLGTPSYMPPEQASSDRGEVGPASDVYSLGAMLYELVTGRPPFRAATLLETLLQVREAEPALPRLLNPAVNRDLETIILKCLAKDSSRRYSSAQDLADDLGRFLRDESILARRPGSLERALRWSSRHRGTVATIAGTAIVVLLALQGAALYRFLNQGAVRLGTDDADLTAQILDQDGRRHVTESFRVPTSSEVLVPPGRYQLRLAASGLPSETWPLDIDRWNGSGFKVRLRSRMLWPPLESSRNTRQFLLPEQDRTDLLLFDPPARRLRRIHGATGRSLWSNDLTLDESQMPTSDEPAQLVLPAPDLDGDGKSDLVFSSAKPPTLLAVSGQDGKVLWQQPGPEHAVITTSPEVVQADSDGRPDLVLCLSTLDRAEVRAVSGKTGQPLWSYPIDKDWLGEPPRGEQLLFNAWTIQPQAVDLAGAPAVLFFAGAKLAALDAHTGKELWPPQDLGLALFRAPQVADFDGQGGPDVLLYGQRLDDFDSPAFGLDARHRPAPDRQPQLISVSLDQRKVMWQVPLAGPRRQVQWHQSIGPHGWANESPQIVDLDGDRKAEVVAVAGSANYDPAGHPPWSGITVLDGVRGSQRWQRRLTSPVYSGAHHIGDNPITYFLAGPDTTGDGCREIFVPWTMFDDEARSRVLVVACLSGANGWPLWIEKTLSQAGNSSGRPFLGSFGDDGWPQLVVPQGGTATMHALSTGRLQQILPGTHGLTAADLDGDDSAELLYSVRPQGAARIIAIAGRPAEKWRQLGSFRLAADFDGDQLPDLLDDGSAIIARSSRDGHRLWETSGHRWEGGSATTAPLPYGDLNGDGIADLVGLTGQTESLSGGMVQHTLTAFSGASGRRLWTSNDFEPGGGGGSSGTEVSLPHIGWHNLDANQQGEILLVHRRGMQGNSSHPLELVVLAGASGRQLWRTDLSEVHLARPPGLDDGTHDLNGDGAADLVLWIPQPGSPPYQPVEALQALSAKDGQVLWTFESDSAGQFVPLQPPAIHDIDGDGIPDVIATRYSPQQHRSEVVLVNGRTGRAAWRWSSEVLDSRVLPPLVAQLDADGRKTIVVQTPAHPQWQVTLLTADGQVRRQSPLRPERHAALNGGWRALDLTGDGRQEILVVAEQSLRALEGDDLHVLWERSLAESAARVVEILPGEKGRAATVVFSTGREVLGLDGQTARPRWRCDLGLDRDAAAGHVQVLSGAEPQALPQIVFQEPGGWATICRQTVPVDADGSPRREPPQSIAPPPATDLTLLRPLPWYLTGSFQQRIAPLAAWNDMTSTYFLSGEVPPQALFTPVAVFLVLVVVPWILWRIYRGNFPRIRTIVAVYAILAAAYLAWLVFWLVLMHPLWLVLFPIVVAATGLMSIPYLLVLRQTWMCLQRRHWWRGVLLVAGSVALAVALAALLLRLDATNKLPDERYQWNGWYLIWFQSVYAIGLVLLLPAEFIRWGWPRLARWFRRPISAGAKAAA